MKKKETLKINKCLAVPVGTAIRIATTLSGENKWFLPLVTWCDTLARSGMLHCCHILLRSKYELRHLNTQQISLKKCISVTNKPKFCSSVNRLIWGVGIICQTTWHDSYRGLWLWCNTWVPYILLLQHFQWLIVLYLCVRADWKCMNTISRCLSSVYFLCS